MKTPYTFYDKTRPTRHHSMNMICSKGGEEIAVKIFNGIEGAEILYKNGVEIMRK